MKNKANRREFEGIYSMKNMNFADNEHIGITISKIRAGVPFHPGSYLAVSMQCQTSKSTSLQLKSHKTKYNT